MQGGCHMLFGPLHNLTHFIPVIDFFIFHLFHRCTGNDQPVKILVLNFLKRLIKLVQVAL